VFFLNILYVQVSGVYLTKQTCLLSTLSTRALSGSSNLETAPTFTDSLTDFLSHSHTPHPSLPSNDRKSVFWAGPEDYHHINNNNCYSNAPLSLSPSLSRPLSISPFFLYLYTFCLDYYFMQCVLSKALFRQTKANSLLYNIASSKTLSVSAIF
jgi:hypothetical protein